MKLRIDRFQIIRRLLILAHFHQAVDHLKMVEKIMPLGPQLQIQRVHLPVHRLKLGNGAHPAAGRQRFLNIQHRAPTGDQCADDGDGPERKPVLPGKVHPENIDHEKQQSHDLQGVDGNGVHNGLADIRFSEGFQHTFLRGGSG